jgi:hypothetical protein
LVFVETAVNEPGLLGLFALEEAAVNEGPEFGFGFPPGGRGGPDVVSENVRVEGFHLLLVRGGKALFGEHVGGRLVFGDVLELGSHPQLVQRALEERDVAADPVDAQPSQGVKDDLVAGRRDVILHVEIGRLLDEGVGFLARPPKFEDGVPQLRGLGPIAFDQVDPEEDGLDAPVSGRLPHIHPEVVDRDGLVPPKEDREDVAGGELLNGPRQANLQVGAGRDDHRCPGELGEDQEEDAGGGEQEEEEKDQQDVGSFFHAPSSLSGAAIRSLRDVSNISKRGPAGKGAFFAPGGLDLSF